MLVGVIIRQGNAVKEQKYPEIKTKMGLTGLNFDLIKIQNEGWYGVEPRPFHLHQDASIVQNSPYFVNDYLDTDQQPAVITPYGQITLHSVVGEAGEGEGAAGPHVET